MGSIHGRLNMAWEYIRENIKTSATKCLGWYELKLQEPRTCSNKKKFGTKEEYL